MTACERALLGHYTPPTSLSRTLNMLSDDVLQLHSVGQLDAAACMHEFFLIAVGNGCERRLMRVGFRHYQARKRDDECHGAGRHLRTLAIVERVLWRTFAPCGRCSRRTNRLVVQPSCAQRGVQCERLSNTMDDSYDVCDSTDRDGVRQDIHHLARYSFARSDGDDGCVDAANYTYHFAVHIPTICEKWAKGLIEPFHEELFKLIANCIMDDNVNVRVVGFKALNALFVFQRQEMAYSATFLVESYSGALEPKMIDELIRELPQLILAKTFAAYRRKHDRFASPKYKKQELIYQTPSHRPAFELKPRKESSFFNQHRQRTGPAQSYLKQPARSQRFHDALETNNKRSPRNTLWQYLRMGGRASRWLVDQIVPRRVQRWLIFWCTAISVVFTLVTLLYWCFLAT